MTPERWQQIKAVLADAREHSQPDRTTWLEEVCQGDSELLSEVTSLLRQEENLEGFIDQPVLQVMASVAEELDNLVGRKVGPYRLAKLLGRGGMGVVYLAEREQDFEQKVALKLLSHTLCDSDTIRRFQEERQILARLEHPNIARLLDGGTTEEGVPYFAMERVEGLPIDQYCDHHRLGTRQRLELFLQVCSALQTAHQRLVVHRDLKPGNILVDEAGRPKLLDFGIAKLLEEDGADTTRTTTQRALTLSYASPEQVKSEAIGTVTDVYSLGVVLYKVLTGRLPGGLEGLPHLDLMVAICQKDPVPPSLVVARSEQLPIGDETVHLTAESVAGTRDGHPQALRRALTGDVDSIVLKALRKEPDLRYGTVDQMAADIRRHLDGRPVLARQGNRIYRLMKWARRYRWGVVAVTGMVGLALIFTLALVNQLRATEQARDRSDEVSSFLIDLFQAAAPDRLAGDEPTLRNLLDLGRDKLVTGLGQEPEVLATLSLRLGEVYSKLGDYPEAAELIQQALDNLRLVHGTEDHTDVARALNNLAVVRYEQGRLEPARELYRQSIDMRRRLGEERNLIKPMNNLAAVLKAQGDFAGAESIYRESLALRQAASTTERGRINIAMNQRNLAATLMAQGRFDEAEELLQSALRTRIEVHGADSPAVASVMMAMGRLEHARGHLDSAGTLLQKGLEIRHAKLGSEHRHTALAMVDLAAVLLERNEIATARELLARALGTLYRVRPAGDWEIAEAEALMGASMIALGRLDDAETCLAQAHHILELRRSSEALETRLARRYLAELYRAQGRDLEADQLADDQLGEP